MLWFEQNVSQYNTVLRRVVCSLLFSYIKWSKVGCCVDSQLTNLSCIKEPLTDSPWKRQILKNKSVSFLPLVMGFAMSFLWGNILKTYGSGQSDVGSGTSMTTCCVVIIIIIIIITLFLQRSYPMFKALHSHVNNIIDKCLQIYNHILLYLQWVKKKGKKLKPKQLLNYLIHNDLKKREKLKLTQYIQIYRHNDLECPKKPKWLRQTND